ncbi:unnamed protein product [Danaus chrysippus]|uniref:(African queen) hypothetical protein n=1 Tax=Danaus chrysippus TaxID=151541 RepID=A0A8J2QLA7_9NEOP|nr:unnamed protein product [Danaus chrysippus]
MKFSLGTGVGTFIIYRNVTLADIAHSAKGYESEDENAGRKRQKASDDRPTSRTTMYSKQEFREQYCINNKQLDLLELEKSKKDRFLGCLSQYHIESPCSRTNRASFLSVCVRRRVPSDENLNTDYAPIQRYPRFGQPSPAPPELCAHDADLECSYFRRRPRSVCSQPDPKRYTWMPEDEDFTRMEWPQSVIEDNSGWPQSYNADQIASVGRGGSLPRPPSIIPCPAHTPIPPPPPPPPLTIPPHRTKHVSFARSHTLTTFDDSVMPAAVSGRYRRDCERLIDGRVVKQENKPYATLPIMFQPFPPYPQYMAQPPAPIHYPPPITPLPAHAQPIPRPTQTEAPKVVVLDSIKKGVMRTQATQTEVCLGRKPLPPNYLSLSPRTIKRVKMVAAGVQTNGFTVGVRRLTKSFSEVGGDRLVGREGQNEVVNVIESLIGPEHEKLHRTQSEEPPRSPRSPTVVPSFPLMQRGDSDDVTSSSVKSLASSSQVDKTSELSVLQKQTQEFFQQNYQFIHESDRDDTIDDDIETIEKSMALNRRNLEYLQQEIAKQAKNERSLRSILSKSTSDASQKTVNSSHVISKTSTFQSEPSTETSATTTDDSEKNEKEIIIDFEPRPDDEAIPFTTLRRKTKRVLQKTLSEGEILLDARKTELNSSTEGVKDAPIIMSTSQENMTKEDREREALYKQYIAQNYNQTPIKDEGIFGFEPDGSFSSSDGNAPYEDFHEKYISYKHEPFRIRSVSFEEKSERCEKEEIPLDSTAKSSPASPDPVTCDVEPKSKRTVITNTVTTILAPLDKLSPCASSESLTVDHSRDHSDSMWNESQTTVLQVDSGTDNGTVISSSDLSSLATSPGALALLTPTSRRKQLLLLQHQQRSSLDTDALDEEFDASQSQSPTSPRNKLDTSSSSSAQPTRASLSPPAVVPNIQLPITKQPTVSKILSPTAPIKLNHTPAIAITHPSLDLSDVPFKRTPSFINKKRERALSPSRRQDLRRAQQKEPNGTIPNKILESPTEPPLSKPASSETSLARTDSGKINNTDVSESTTTTEDYVTANSDSSKKSNNKNHNHNSENNNKAQEGSSFESASSLYSSTKTDNVAEDLIVPSFSPPLEISDDFMVPNLSSPPLPLPERIPKPSVERIEVKADITPIAEANRKNKTDLIKPKDDIPRKPNIGASRDAISGKSSSSGSYSIGGSNPNVTEPSDEKISKEKIKNVSETVDKQDIKIKEEKKELRTNGRREQLVPKLVGSLSDDERSVHYSSSGYYESPIEDDDDGGLTYKHSQKYRSSNRPKAWLSEEKRRKKKAFTLEFSKSYDDSISTSQDDWGQKSKEPDVVRPERNIFKYSSTKSSLEEKVCDIRKKKTHFIEKPKSVQSSPREPVDIEKSIKEKMLKEKDNGNKRPVERERYVKRTKLKAKSPTQNKSIDNNYRQSHYDRRDTLGSNIKLHLNIPTSDDSSEQYRKDGLGNGNVSPRKHRRLRDSPRRKTGSNSNNAKSPTSNNHTCYRPRRKSGSNESISLPGSLPRRKQSIPTVPCLSSLEAEDIEAARTLSRAGSRLTPLRYLKSPTASPRRKKSEKEGKFAKAASAESLRSVSPGSDSVFYSEHTEHGDGDEARAHCLHCGKEVHIVTAANEHDASASRTSQTDESYADATPDIVPAPAGFADSPSCGAAKKPASGARLYKKLDKRYRSEDKTKHHYRHRQDVRAKSEERGKDVYEGIEKPQDTRIARSAGNSLDKLATNTSGDPDEPEECSGSSEGVDEEKGVYATPWWCGNWILLSENNDNWSRIPPDALQQQKEDPTDSETEFNKRYVALTHRLVHRRACIELNRRQADNSFESDKTVVVRRGNEEFGFRIHGSKPVVVSAIEPDTPAESSGLEVGDIIISVNGINVLDKTHSEVVKIAHSGSEILELDVARTCEVVATLAHETGAAALYSGYLWRAATSRNHQRWTRRWFVLKRDNCLYYYKTDSSIHPVGALMLVNYQLTEEDAGRPHGFRLQRGGGTRLTLAADSAEAAARWQAVLAHAIDASNQRDGWLEVTMRNMKLPPSSIPRPDCFGYLMKLGSKWKSWAKRYCVLKDACLYFYNEGNSKSAFGMACLHGYRIQTSSTGGKKYAFEVTPTEPKQRHFYFHTESEMDRKR